MYVKRNYGFWMTLNWSKWPFIYGLLYSAMVCVIVEFFEITIALPWQPITIIGIAVAFYLGFKNNSSYDRTWEARKIWGSMVNNSRTFGAAIVAFVKGEDQAAIRKELVYRHVAWLIALRHQLRLKRDWEHTEDRLDNFEPTICKDYYDKLNEQLSQYLDKEELDSYQSSSNMATQILRKQSERLQELREQEYFEDFRHMEFHHLISTFYTDQGKSERIKNFPFPRQYASTALWLTFVFCFMVPFGMVDIFQQFNNWMFWLCPVITGLIIWVFFLMEKIGDYSENPFEGSYNDVPITSISRTIEIDMREMIADENIPPSVESRNGFIL